MNAFTTNLVAQLRTAGHPAEAPWPTGGGCEQIGIEPAHWKSASPMATPHSQTATCTTG